MFMNDWLWVCMAYSKWLQWWVELIFPESIGGLLVNLHFESRSGAWLSSSLLSWFVHHSRIRPLLSQGSFRIFLSERLQTSVDLCCLDQAWLGCSHLSRMARRLPLPQASNRNATLAAWTAVVFAAITALAVWGVANAYPPTLLLPWSIQGNGPFPLSCERRLNCFGTQARRLSVSAASRSGTDGDQTICVTLLVD